MNFDAYNHKDLQHCFQLLNQCEAEGVTDIRFVREALHKHLYKPQKVRHVRQKKVQQQKKLTCPSCNGAFLVGPYKLDGLLIIRCSKKCGYSEVIK